MTPRNPPRRQHWRSVGTEPLPSGAEAMGEPFSAFPSWFLRIECDRCGKVRMVNEQRIIAVDLPIRILLDKMNTQEHAP